MARWPQKEYPHDPQWTKGRNAFRCLVCDRRVHFKASVKKPNHPISRCPGTDPTRPKFVPPAPPPPPPNPLLGTTAGMLLACATAIIGEPFPTIGVLDELDP